MNFSSWWIYLLVSCMACSKPSTPDMPSPDIDGPYQVTAVLNDSTWFGSAYASRTIQSTCSMNRFDIGFSTDLPYDTHPSPRPVTGCLSGCIPTQSLGFQNIPLAVGKYEIASLNSCAGQQGAVKYFWLLGGDGIINTFTSQASQTGWIQVTGYNASQNAVEGTFEVTLSNQMGQTAHFKKGAFKALIK